MKTSSIRERKRAEQKKAKIKNGVIQVIIILAVGGLIGFFVWDTIRPLVGEEIPVLDEDLNHLAAGQPSVFTTNPPTAGAHSGSPLQSGFYDDVDLPNLPPNPESNIVHNLEHGYVAIWYNCDILDEAECETLKTEIQTAMREFGFVKLIAIPWNSIDVPLAMTSWGQRLLLEEFDAGDVREFISVNRNKSPEPDAR